METLLLEKIEIWSRMCFQKVLIRWQVIHQLTIGQNLLKEQFVRESSHNDIIIHIEILIKVWRKLIN